MHHLSENDKRVYAFIRNRIVHGEAVPTLAEINGVTNHLSPRSAVLALERLEEAGLISRQGRSIRLLNAGLNSNASESTVDVPLVGSVAAGAPIFAEENIEAVLPITKTLARPGFKYFLLRVTGTSMNLAEIGGVRIEDGSILLVRQQPSADDGNIVVALINDEATVKMLERRNGLVILRPRSSVAEHKPIVLSDNCVIQGVAVAVLPSDLY